MLLTGSGSLLHPPRMLRLHEKLLQSSHRFPFVVATRIGSAVLLRPDWWPFRSRYHSRSIVICFQMDDDWHRCVWYPGEMHYDQVMARSIFDLPMYVTYQDGCSMGLGIEARIYRGPAPRQSLPVYDMERIVHRNLNYLWPCSLVGHPYGHLYPYCRGKGRGREHRVLERRSSQLMSASW